MMDAVEHFAFGAQGARVSYFLSLVISSSFPTFCNAYGFPTVIRDDRNGINRGVDMRVWSRIGLTERLNRSCKVWHGITSSIEG